MKKTTTPLVASWQQLLSNLGQEEEEGRKDGLARHLNLAKVHTDVPAARGGGETARFDNFGRQECRVYVHTRQASYAGGAAGGRGGGRRVQACTTVISIRGNPVCASHVRARAASTQEYQRRLSTSGWRVVGRTPRLNRIQAFPSHGVVTRPRLGFATFLSTLPCESLDECVNLHVAATVATATTAAVAAAASKVLACH